VIRRGPFGNPSALSVHRQRIILVLKSGLSSHVTARSPYWDDDIGECKDVKCVGKETAGNRVERVQDFTAGRETRSRGKLVDVARLEKEYFDRRPDLEDANQLVVFGTSGHRGTSLNSTFTEAHVLAIPRRSAITARRKGLRES